MRQRSRAGAAGFLGLAAALSFVPFPALAQSVPADPSLLCEQAIASTERSGQVPPKLLGAIAQVESGRRDPSVGSIRPWPWSINADGRGFILGSKAEAITAILGLRAKGIFSIDVGCMQINLMHHPRAFSTLDEALDPAANTQYAARFLSALHDETGAWNMAIAFYHSRTPTLGSGYQQKVALRLQQPVALTSLPRQDRALADAWAATRSDGRGPSGAGAGLTTWLTALGGAGRQRTQPHVLFASVR